MNKRFASETVLETGGGNAESEATLVMNLIPQEGGNQFSFGAFGTYTNDSLQSDNLTDELKAQGVTHTNEQLKFYNADITVGGPIKQDKVWFFAAGRAARNINTVPGVFFNAGQGTPHYVPDLDRPAYRTEWMRSGGGRITWQASQRNKIGVFTDFQTFFNRGRGEFASPEAYRLQFNLSPEALYQATWTSPVSNRLLVEGGVSHMRGRWPYPAPGEAEFAANPNDISTVEATTGLRYGARSSYSNVTDQYRFSERAALSYVTGSHAVKAGFLMEQGQTNADREFLGGMEFDFRNGVPFRLRQHATYADPSLKKDRSQSLAIYFQDQWTLPRVSINYGLRFDRFTGNVPAQSLAASEFIPFQRDFAAVNDVLGFNDVNPRLGVSYDLFGNGRTALKFAVGKYVEGTVGRLVSRLNPISTSVTSARRTWNDANGNFRPDCDLVSIAANGECGAVDDQNFGQNNPKATQYADNVVRGWGNRNHSWDIAAEVVHELAPGMSLTAGYYRSTSANWRVTDNVLLSPEDFDPFCATAPMDPRLPGGGGYEVCGLYDIKPEKFGQSDNLLTNATEFIGSTSGVTCGAQRSGGRAPSAGRHCGTNDFFGVSLDTRFNNGATLGGGFDTGKTVINNCFVIDSPQSGRR